MPTPLCPTSLSPRLALPRKTELPSIVCRTEERPDSNKISDGVLSVREPLFSNSIFLLASRMQRGWLCGLAVLLAAVSCSANSSTVRWGQDDEVLYVTGSDGCPYSSPRYSFSHARTRSLLEWYVENERARRQWQHASIPSPVFSDGSASCWLSVSTPVLGCRRASTLPLPPFPSILMPPARRRLPDRGDGREGRGRGKGEGGREGSRERRCLERKKHRGSTAPSMDTSSLSPLHLRLSLILHDRQTR